MKTFPLGLARSTGLVLLAGWMMASTVRGANAPLRLEWGQIDTSSPEQQALSQKVKKSPRATSVQRQNSRGKVPWLVQFHAAIREEKKSELKKAGAELKGYFPENAFLVEATPQAIAKIAALPDVK